MNILITGANGFMGKNLCATLSQGNDRLYRIDADASEAELAQAAGEADFVFHLAGVNRPVDEADFQRGNADFTQHLLALLTKCRKPPVLLSGSTQAALDNPYGRSKKAAEDALRLYGRQTGAPVYLYRLPNAFGKWSRPNYNSAVATFCYNLSRGLPITVTDPSRLLTLAYIDDIVAEFLRAMAGRVQPDSDGFCHVEPEHAISLGQIVDLLTGFRDGRTALALPDASEPIVGKLFATYQSFLPEDGFAVKPAMHADERGSFTELLHMGGHGQISVNISKPGIVKGEHWHHTKHEKFAVVSGNGVICLRQIYGTDVLRYEVDGASPTVVDIPPGYTHNIENLGQSDMVTLMWASEPFDPNRPDTYRLPVHPDANGR